ncbi:MAG: hypothetical protein GF332_00615, partial [Candidatus Moranbacteria bacterium]|nr:hypothetical protein [Candidatus Moranbacteria bacterium]
MKSISLKILGILVLFLAGLAVVFSTYLPDFTLFNKNITQPLKKLEIKQGLDLKGGAHLVFQADVSQIQGQEKITQSLTGAKDVIERRINAYGISEAEVVTSQSQGEHRIIVDLPGVEDVSQAIEMIGQTPTLDFREPKTDQDYALTPEEKEQIKAQNQETKKNAQEVLKQAKQGQDFAELAKKHSQDPGTKEKGGDLGFFTKDTMVPEFSQVIFNPDFQAGQVWDELVKTQFGYHIIKKIEQRGEGEEKEIKASHILFKLLDEEKKTETGFPYKLTELTGKHLKSAQAGTHPVTQEPVVILNFNDQGTKLFREITERNLNQPVAIFLDGMPISVPVVQS